MSTPSRGGFRGTSAVLHRTFETLFSALKPCALIWNEGGSTLFVSNQIAAIDLATLPQAAELCHRYLKLKNGEFAITNDPLAGGTVLSAFTLVMGVQMDGAAKDCDLLLARRISFAPRLNTGSLKPIRLDDEGVRVPPTPLSNKGEINRDLLQAIASHPNAPRGLFERVLEATREMQTAAKNLQTVAADPGTILKKSNLTTYLEDSRLAFEMLLTRLPLGAITVTSLLSRGETLKLQLKITEDRLLFDFGGTENSERIALTELAAFGACFAATVSILDDSLPFNSGTYQFFQVTAPTKTMLAATVNTGTYRGMHEGSAAVCELVRSAITLLSPKFSRVAQAATVGALQVKFADGRVLALQLPAGSPATSSANGISGANAWNVSSEMPSQIEDLEREFPVLFTSAGQRAGSGGLGKFIGGEGIVLGLEALEIGQLEWVEPSLGRRVEGASGGGSGQVSSLEIVRLADGSRETLTAAEGTAQLNPGDKVYFLSTGGSGFGEPNGSGT